MLVSLLLALAVFTAKTDTCIRTQPPEETTTSQLPTTTTLVTTTVAETTTTTTSSTTASSTTSTSTTTTTSSTTTTTTTTSTTTTTTTTTTGCSSKCEMATGLPEVCPYPTCVPATDDVLVRDDTGCGSFSCMDIFAVGVIAPDGTTYVGNFVECNIDGHKYFTIGDGNGQRIIVDDYAAFCGQP